MSDLLTALIEATVAEAHWAGFWDRLTAGHVRREEAAAVLAALSATPPDVTRTKPFVTSLRVRRPAAPAIDGCVSIVGTGGGTRTFHIGTAAALVAAAMGVPVVKAASGALTNDLGSIDVLERIGVPVARGYDELAEQVAAHGIGFAGSFVYPDEIGILARRIFPLDFRVAGRFVSRIGPLLANLPESPQLTGVSDVALLPVLEQAGAGCTRHRRQLAVNPHRVPALLSTTGNTLHDGSSRISIDPQRLGLGGGDLADLVPADGVDAADRLRRILAGDACAAEVNTVLLNAAALAVLAGHQWADAVAEARSVLHGGAAAELIDRLRSIPARLS